MVVMRRTLFPFAGILALVSACQPAPRMSRATPLPTRVSEPPARDITRELAVATFDSVWSKVRATYYDTTLKGLDWYAVRRELRPRAERAETRVALRAVLTEMLSRLGDSHMSVLPREFVAPSPNDSDSDAAPGGVGVETRILANRLVVFRVDPRGPAALAGVRGGWTVDSVDGTRADSAIAELARVRNPKLRRTLFVHLTARLQHRFEGPAKSLVRASFRDERGVPRHLTIERAPLEGQAVKLGHMPTLVAHASSRRLPGTTTCVGVLRFNYWLLPVMPTLTKAMQSFEECEGVIVDLRGNVGGLAAMLSGVSGFMVDTAASLALVTARGQEIRYDVFPRRADAQGRRVKPYSGPIAILIDPLTVSTSEVFAAGMRQVTRGRTRVFGERSAGQALPALVSKLPTGDALMHAVGDLRLADGSRIEGAGVRPDVEIPLRASDLQAGRDAPLDAALRWIADWNRAAAGA